MKKRIASLMNTSVSDAKISLDIILKKNPTEAKEIAEELLRELEKSDGQVSRRRMADTIKKKAEKILNN